MTDIVAHLTTEEDTFALAVIEYGGNLGAAYCAAFGDDVKNPVAKARELLTRPDIASRIQKLSLAVEEHAYISLGSHMTQLAEIRDLAKGLKQMKVALEAEQSRGQVAGYYAGKNGARDPNKPANDSPHVVINIGTPSASVQDWAAKHGKPPVIIDV